MRLQCLRERLTESQPAYQQLKLSPRAGFAGSSFDVEIGREYTPLGLYLHHGVLWAYIVNIHSQLRIAPLALFEVTDGALPSQWKLSVEAESGAVFVAPPDASTLWFVDDVDECRAPASEVYVKLLRDAGL